VDPSLFLNSQSARVPLRIGLLLNSNKLPIWTAEVIEQILNSSFARVELVVYNEAQDTAPLKRGKLALLGDRQFHRRLLFHLYSKWDRRHTEVRDYPLREIDCSNHLSRVSALHVTPIVRRFEHRFSDDAITCIREKKLDVLLRFGFNILRGEILKAARYGIWSYHHGDNDCYRGGPAYLWELIEKNPLSGAVLQVLTEELDAGEVLCKGQFATCAGASLARNRIQPYWGASTFVIQKLRQLHERGWESLEGNKILPVPYRGRRKIYRAPTNLEMLRWLVPFVLRKTKARAERWFRGIRINHWMLAVSSGQGKKLAESSGDLKGFRQIHSPQGHFYADPFLLEHEQKSWLFFEDFTYAERRAVIAVAEVKEDGSLAEPLPALSRPYHLSYPCVFRADGELYMVPESRANQSVELYRCKRFPDDWELVKTYMRGSAVDTTVWIENGLCWFFVTMRERRGGGLQLWLFYSKGIMEDWISHPANPISTDVRNSRGGGAIFRDGTRLIRPSQDCSGEYGSSFTLNEILALTPQEYIERPYLTVKPPAGMAGTHTYSRLDGIEFTDIFGPMPCAR